MIVVFKVPYIKISHIYSKKLTEITGLRLLIIPNPHFQISISAPESEQIILYQQ